MDVYRGKLELLDYVFYATVERGKIYETGAFVHNYALTYALRLAMAPYSHAIQKPNYQEELRPLNDVGVYLTPAAPLQTSHRLVQWNTMQERYAIPGKERSIGYPDWGFARVLQPGCRFKFYILVEDGMGLEPGNLSVAFADLLDDRTVRIRLGKFPGKVRVEVEAAEDVQKKSAGAFTSYALLNWRDLPAEPLICDVLAASLPTRLLQNARFENQKHVVATFGEDDCIALPFGMQYFMRMP